MANAYIDLMLLLMLVMMDYCQSTCACQSWKFLGKGKCLEISQKLDNCREANLVRGSSLLSTSCMYLWQLACFVPW